MKEEAAGETVAEVLRFCAAVREAHPMLQMADTDMAQLIASTTRAEQAAQAQPVDYPGIATELRAMRYTLIETGDGPIAAILANRLSRIIGDEIGRLFL